MRQAFMAMGAVVALALASTVSAKPLEKQNIPSDAKWLMHFDVDNFRETRLAEHIRQERLDEPQAQRWLNWVEERYGINLREDLHGVTLYGTSYEPHRGVVLLSGDYNREKTIEVVEGEPGYKTSEYGDYTLHTWNLSDGQGDKHRKPGDEAKRPRTLTAAFHDKGVVMGTSNESLKQALDTLDGKESGLEDSSPLLGARPRGTVFYGAAIELSNLADREEQLRKFAVLQQGEYVNVALGQHEGTAFYRVRFEAQSQDIAEQIGKILTGFEAMLDLQAENNETLANVAEGFKWNVDDTTVTVNWKAQSEDVVQLVKQRLERMPFRQAQREPRAQVEQEERAPQEQR